VWYEQRTTYKLFKNKVNSKEGTIMNRDRDGLLFCKHLIEKCVVKSGPPVNRRGSEFSFTNPIGVMAERDNLELV